VARIANDRRYALHRTGDLSGLPWASPRQFPQLLSWNAIVSSTGDLTVTLPDTTWWRIDPRDPTTRREFSAHASSELNEAVTLINLWAGTYDAMPISVISSDTISACTQLFGSTTPVLDWQRFRPNVVIATDGARPWPERKWLGRELRLGDSSGAVTLRVDRHTTRCEVVNFDPVTAQRTDDLFSAIREANKNRAGVYASPERGGLVELGADVFVR